MIGRSLSPELHRVLLLTRQARHSLRFRGKGSGSAKELGGLAPHARERAPDAFQACPARLSGSGSRQSAAAHAAGSDGRGLAPHPLSRALALAGRPGTLARITTQEGRAERPSWIGVAGFAPAASASQAQRSRS